MHAAADEYPFVQVPGIGAVPKYRWEIHRLPGVREPGKCPPRRPARRDQTASPPVDLESLLPGWRCELHARPADMFLVRHGGFLPPYVGQICQQSGNFPEADWPQTFRTRPSSGDSLLHEALRTRD